LIKLRGAGKQLSLDSADVAAWLRAHRARMRAREIADRAQISTVKLSRILSGRSQVSLTDFFTLVNAMTDRLTDLLAALVDIRQLPSAVRLHAQLEASRALAFSDPWTSAVLALLETDSYLKSPLSAADFLARCLGLEAEAGLRALEALRQSGLIQRRQGKYRIRRPLTIDTRGHQALSRKLRQHWVGVSAERLRTPGERDLFSYNVFAVSRADFERIRGVLQQCFRELRAIVAASRPSETAALVTLHLFEWNERAAVEPRSSG